MLNPSISGTSAKGRLFGGFFILAGWLCLLLGSLGIFLPLLPTTPFILLAAFCFSRGSDKLHAWLLQNKTFGPTIRDWESYRVIKPKAKWLSTILMSAMIGYAVLFKSIALWPKVLMLIVLMSVLGFIWNCPSRYPRQ